MRYRVSGSVRKPCLSRKAVGRTRARVKMASVIFLNIDSQSDSVSSLYSWLCISNLTPRSAYPRRKLVIRPNSHTSFLREVIREMRALWVYEKFINYSTPRSPRYEKGWHLRDYDQRALRHVLSSMWFIIWVKTRSRDSQCTEQRWIMVLCHLRQVDGWIREDWMNRAVCATDQQVIQQLYEDLASPDHKMVAWSSR